MITSEVNMVFVDGNTQFVMVEEEKQVLLSKETASKCHLDRFGLG
jgi:hypothetical protein